MGPKKRETRRQRFGRQCCIFFILSFAHAASASASARAKDRESEMAGSDISVSKAPFQKVI